MGREHRRKVIFYGDSNTFGYDPADMYDRRFPEDKRWTTIVAKRFVSEIEVIPEGMNGRKIPDPRYDTSYLKGIVDSVDDRGLFCTMLGTNDILLTMEPDAEYAIRRMEAYLEYLLTCLCPEQILIVAPPHIGSARMSDPLYHKFYVESLRMNTAFERMTGEKKIWFSDASRWNIEMSFDQVHFSERGHQVFAEKMAELLESIMSLKKTSTEKAPHQ